MSNIIRLQYITDEGVANLKNNFTVNLPHYKSKDNKIFLNYLKDNNYLLESAYECNDFFSDLKYSKDSNHLDLENIKTVYSAMKDIPASVAFDERLWVGMTHTIMWEYIKKRRKEEAFDYNGKNQQDKIYNSFFTYTKHGKKRGTFVNCVSRLWWAGYLSYDEDNKENPFELTEQICKTGFSSTIVLLSSSNILSRKETIIAVLSVTKKRREAGYIITRNDLVGAVKYLNLVAGITLLDLLGRDEIEEMIDDYYDKKLKTLVV